MEQSDSGSEVIPPSQIKRTGVKVKRTARKPEPRLSEDEEVERLTRHHEDLERATNSNRLAELREWNERSEDAQEYSQAY